MGDLTENLSRHEFKSSDGQEIAVDYQLVKSLQESRDYFSRITNRNVGISITSGYRSPELNARTPNAAKKSMHLFGKAADYFLYFKDTNKRLKSSLLYSYLDEKYKGKFGVSLYRNRVHFDVRSHEWRDPRVKS